MFFFQVSVLRIGAVKGFLALGVISRCPPSEGIAKFGADNCPPFVALWAWDDLLFTSWSGRQVSVLFLPKFHLFFPSLSHPLDISF